MSKKRINYVLHGHTNDPPKLPTSIFHPCLIRCVILSFFLSRIHEWHSTWNILLNHSERSYNYSSSHFVQRNNWESYNYRYEGRQSHKM